MATKKVLGKGLGALLGDDINSSAILESSNIKMLNITSISPNSYQPRKTFDEYKLKELADSINENGLIQPIIVTKRDNNYEIIVGERRWRACKSLGYTSIPAIIKEASSYEFLELALIENVQREDLNPIEEAKSYKELLDNLGITQEKLSDKVGKSRVTISNTIRLLKLPESIQNDIIHNVISEGHARTLLALKDNNYILDVRKLITKHSLSVRQTETLVNAINTESGINNDILSIIFGYKNDIKKDNLVNKDKKALLPSIKKVYEFELEGIGKIEDMELKLKGIFNTKVNIKNKPLTNNGKIEIKYTNKDELRRIINKLGVSSQVENK